MISRNSNVGCSLFDHAEHGSEHTAYGSHFSTIRITRRGERIIMPKQLVRAVNQINLQFPAPRKPYRSRAGKSTLVLARVGADALVCPKGRKLRSLTSAFPKE